VVDTVCRQYGIVPLRLFVPLPTTTTTTSATATPTPDSITSHILSSACSWLSSTQIVRSAQYPIEVIAAPMPILRHISGLQSSTTHDTDVLHATSSSSSSSLLRPLMAQVAIPAAASIQQLFPSSSSSNNNNNNDDEVGSILHTRRSRVLVLDRVQDPGNVGTLIRSAAAFDLSGVCLLPDCADVFNDKCLRSAAGATFAVPITNVTHQALHTALSASGTELWIADCKPFQLDASKTIATATTPTPTTTPLDTSCIPHRVALLLGSEGTGPTHSSLPASVRYRHVQVPMAQSIESLNVAVAGSILIHQIASQSPPLLTNL
jgi:tRNA G18 (ribose-2'-O)-methylase SpoU